MCVENLSEFTVMILHSMPFVNDHVLPLDFGQMSFVFDDVLVGRHQDIEFGVFDLVLKCSSYVR